MYKLAVYYTGIIHIIIYKNMFEFLKNNWGTIATILFLTSELLANIPQIKSNSIFQLIFGFLQKTQNKE